MTPRCPQCRMPLHYSVCPRCIDSEGEAAEDVKFQTKLARITAEHNEAAGIRRQPEKWESYRK